MNPRLLLYPLVVLLSLACRTTQPVEAKAPAASHPPVVQEPIRLVVVGTNDVHGWAAPHLTPLADGAVLREGGLAAFSAYVAVLRAQYGEGLLLLDGGDMFQGTLASNLSEGALIIDVYNQLGYTAAAIGNHEFDYGPVGPAPVVLEPGQDPLGALKARVKQAKFPLLAANIHEVSGGTQPAWLGNDGTALIERKGLKIGIVGLITESTPTTTNPMNVAALRFDDLTATTLAAVQKLRQRGADLVLGVAHAGGRCHDRSNPKDLSSCEHADSEIFTLLQNLPPRTLDAVVAGHTHAPLGHFVNETPVIETSGMARSFGMIELAVDPVQRKVRTDETRIEAAIPLCLDVEKSTGSCDPSVVTAVHEAKQVPATFRGQTLRADPAVEAIIAPALVKVEEQQKRPLGVQVPATLTRSYEKESPLGSLLADSLKVAAQADVALLNPGGLRSDLRAGHATYGDLFEVLPFDNTVAQLTLTGTQLTQLLEKVYAERDGVFQVSGLSVILAPCGNARKLTRLTLANGKPLQPKRLYRVVLPDFLARGGEGLVPFLATLPPGSIDMGNARALNLRDALVAYWQKRGQPLLAPKPGRITFGPAPATCPSGSTATTSAPHAH